MDNILFKKMLEVENKHWWFVSRRKIIFTLIKTLDLGYTPRIFEAGCGNGDNLVFLSKLGATVAIEKEKDALDAARQRNLAEVYCGDLPDNIPDNIAHNNNLIALLDVLEHIEEDVMTLKKLGSYLDDKGYMVITVPAYEFLWSRHDDLHHHKRRYTKPLLENVIKEADLKVIYASYFNTFLFPLAFIERMVKRMFPKLDDGMVKSPNIFINYLFEKIFSFESNFIGKTSFPFGLSLIFIVKKSD